MVDFATLPAAPSMMDAFSNINALRRQNIENKYLPAKTMAQVASQMAYANLMGPQFVAKLMGNSDIVANSPQLQNPATIAKLYQAGIGQGTGANVFANPGAMPSSSFIDNIVEPDSILGKAVREVKNAFGFSDKLPQMQNNNPLSQDVNLGQPLNLSQQDRNAISNMQPGDSYVVGQPSNALVEPSYTPSQPKTYAETSGEFAGTKKELERSGEIRANDIKDLNEIVFNAENNQATLDDISDILGSPQFEQMRQVPILGHRELGFYSKFGTPEQQQMVGRYFTDTGNVIKNSARDFPGAFRRGEQQLLNGMKPNPSDTVDTARGKTESLSYFNKLLHERSKLTSQYMEKYHINKLKAMELADQQLNGNDIRQQIHDKLNPVVTIKNKRTGEIVTVPIGEARSKYGVK